MLISKQFYTFQTRVGSGGMQFVNINNIASIEDANPGCIVTLIVKNDKGEYIRFTADLPFGHVNGTIASMDDRQKEL